MKKTILLLIIIFTCKVNAQNSCFNHYSLCQSFSYPALVGTSTGSGPNYGCLNSMPNPTWFFTQVTTSGTLQYSFSNTNNLDVDFVCWGPYSNMNGMCYQLDASHVVDCNFLSNTVDTCTIPGAIAGEYSRPGRQRAGGSGYGEVQARPNCECLEPRNSAL